MEQDAQVGLDAIAVLGGERVPIRDLERIEQLPPGATYPMLESGLGYFRRIDEFDEEKFARTVGETLTRGGLAAESLAGVVCVIDAHLEWPMVNALRSLGVGRLPLVQLGLQDCTSGAAFWTAAQLLARSDTAQDVLLIFAAQHPRETSRLTPGARVCSDGLACALVRKHHYRYRLAAVDFHFDLLMHGYNAKTLSFAQNLRRSSQGIVSVARAVLPQGKLSESDLVICTNGIAAHFDIVSSLLRVPRSLVYDGNLEERGHAYACDNLISLSDAEAGGRFQEGSRVCLLSWTPIVSSATLLEVA